MTPADRSRYRAAIRTPGRWHPLRGAQGRMAAALAQECMTAAIVAWFLWVTLS